MVMAFPTHLRSIFFRPRKHLANNLMLFILPCTLLLKDRKRKPEMKCVITYFGFNLSSSLAQKKISNEKRKKKTTLGEATF